MLADLNNSIVSPEEKSLQGFHNKFQIRIRYKFLPKKKKNPHFIINKQQMFLSNNLIRMKNTNPNELHNTFQVEVSPVKLLVKNPYHL